MVNKKLGNISTTFCVEIRHYVNRLYNRLFHMRECRNRAKCQVTDTYTSQQPSRKNYFGNVVKELCFIWPLRTGHL